MVGAGQGQGEEVGETDKHIRQFRRNSSEHVAAKAKIAAARSNDSKRTPSEAVESWGPPAWRSRLHPDAARWSPASWAVVRRGTFPLGSVDLEIPLRRALSALLGSNGSGKTTLLDAALGWIPLDAGEARVGPGARRDRRARSRKARAAFAGAEPLLRFGR